MSTSLGLPAAIAAVVLAVLFIVMVGSNMLAQIPTTTINGTVYEQSYETMANVGPMMINLIGQPMLLVFAVFGIIAVVGLIGKIGR